MSDWFSRLLSGWAALSAAPILLAAAIVLPAAITWAAVDWLYSSALAGRNAEIAELNARLSAYRNAVGGADAERAAGDILSLREQLGAATKELAEIQSPERDPSAVYQNAQRIGRVSGVELDAANTTVGFQRMMLDREFDQAINIEFRDLVLSLKGYAAITRIARSAGVIYHEPRFAVVRRRGEGCPGAPATGSAKQ